MADTITNSVIVKGNAAQIFNLWSNFENFPYFMKYIKSVTITGEKTSHWVMEGPLGKDLEWDAQITDIQDNKRIAWNSISGDIKTSGQVTFMDLPSNQTEVTIKLHYAVPSGMLGEMASKLFDNPEKKLDEDLRQFKKFAENISHYTRKPQPIEII